MNNVVKSVPISGFNIIKYMHLIEKFIHCCQSELKHRVYYMPATGNIEILLAFLHDDRRLERKESN